MPTAHVRSSQVRRTETPNAVMTTLASPSQGPTTALSLWRVEMRAGQRGPSHAFDSEQVWHVMAGEVDIAADGQVVRLARGDTVVLAAGTERQVQAVTDTRLMVCGYGTAVVSVTGEDSTRGVPAWIS
ncbi:MAG TPA: cupin domain-containing protein [Streptosporangiaceae bacterium]|nr:cupin domain-containing protein [Streptosporangiaceae bacterium]